MNDRTLEEVTLDCVVRIQNDNTLLGTGFFVSSNLVLTCAHVIKGINTQQLAIKQLRKGKSYTVLEVSRLDSSSYPDAALLKIDGSYPHSVYFNASISLKDTLFAHGYTDTIQDGESTTFEYEGLSSPLTYSHLKFKLGQVRPGYSGSPLINLRTGAVCGMVRISRNRASLLGGRAIPVSTIVKSFPELKEYCFNFHNENMQWENFVLPSETKPNTIQATCDNYAAFARRLIIEKTQGFVGRKFVLERFDSFTKENKNGYFLIKGDPGIGKSSIAAKIVSLHETVAHFIERKTLNTELHFYKNICSQLIISYNLPYDELPQDFNLNTAFLLNILDQATEKLTENERIVIVIDALDELATKSSHIGNLLNLPLHLPDKVYVVVTMRRGINLRIESPHDQVHLEQDSHQNLEDIKEYIGNSLSEPNIGSYIQDQASSESDFISDLADKSQGNFMYLRLVLREIEKGDYQKRSLTSLPRGLENYYEDHWERMRSSEGWLEYKLPTLATITIVDHPISVQEIIDFRIYTKSKKISPQLILICFEQWIEFLFNEKRIYKNQEVQGYRIYHNSYREFINKKNAIQLEQVNLEKTNEAYIEFHLDDLDEYL